MMRLISVRGKGKNLKFKLDKFERNIILDEVCHSQNYFPRINCYLDYKIEDKDTVIDIGANVGIFSVFAANLANHGRVYSFEPVKENFERLQYHKKLNRLNNIILEKKAISDRKRKVKIYLIEKNSGGHSFHKGKFKKLHEKIQSTEMVDCLPLKEVFDKYKIKKCNFLKLDCEGEEYKILTKLPAGYFTRIDKIVLEYHKPIVNEIALAKFLFKRGYIITISNYGNVLGMIFAKRNIEKRS